MKKLLLSLSLVALLFSCNKSASDKTTDNNVHIYHNGDIITMESDSPVYVEAVVEQNGKIIFTGTQKDAEAKYANAKKVDLQGKTMLPGFIDPHSHFGNVSNSMGQVDLNPPPVGGVESIADIKQKLKKYKTDNNIADGEWIFGWGYDESQLKEKKHPTKMDIDEVLPNNPVYLQHTSGHLGVANSAGLAQMKITADSKDPEGGTIDRLPNSKEPSGLLLETAMYSITGNMIQELKKNDGKHFEATQNYYAENGITTAQDGMTDRSAIQFFQSQADAGKLKIDLVALGGYVDIEENVKDANMPFKTYKNGFKVQGTKIVLDGSPQGLTAFFTEPFLVPVPGCESDCKGLPSLTQDYLNKLFLTGYKNDNQLFIHGNGDAAIDMIIKAHENACKVLNQPLDKDRRTIVIHSQFVRPDQLQTYKKYNMEPSFFTNHAYFWGDSHVENLGEKRAFFLSPIVAADKLGLKFTNHSDAVVTPIDPIFTLWSAVNRISRSGKVIGQEQRATVYQALKAITINAAYEYFEEKSKGSLTAGKMADFVILDKNPLKVEPMKIRDITVMETIKEGKSIYKL